MYDSTDTVYGFQIFIDSEDEVEYDDEWDKAEEEKEQV